jgi:hypothetical protein
VFYVQADFDESRTGGLDAAICGQTDVEKITGKFLLYFSAVLEPQ